MIMALANQSETNRNSPTKPPYQSTVGGNLPRSMVAFTSFIVMSFLLQLQRHYILYVVGVGEHIHRLHAGDFIRGIQQL